jgi:hypothetical protein
MGPTCQKFLTLQDAQAASDARTRGPARHVPDDLFIRQKIPDVRLSACIACRIAYAPAAFFSGKHVLQDDLEDAMQSVLRLSTSGTLYASAIWFSGRKMPQRVRHRLPQPALVRYLWRDSGWIVDAPLLRTWPGAHGATARRGGEGVAGAEERVRPPSLCRRDGAVPHGGEEAIRTYGPLYSSSICPSQQDSLLYTQFSRTHPSSISSSMHSIHCGTHLSLYLNISMCDLVLKDLLRRI